MADSLVIAPLPRRFGLADPARNLYLTRTLAKDTEIPHEELITHLGFRGLHANRNWWSCRGNSRPRRQALLLLPEPLALSYLLLAIR